MKRSVLILLSLLSGVLLALSWPQNGLTLLIFVAFVPLLIVQQEVGDHKRKGMFWYAFLAFLVWNLLTTWWIWNSTAAGAAAAWILNTLFMTIVFYLFHLSKVKLFNNKRGTAILLFYWVTWEYFHQNWDLTWPWLNLGNIFSSKHTWIQWYEYTGIFGGTVWVLVTNFLLFTVINAVRHNDKGRAILNAAGAVLLIVAPLTVSKVIYNNYEEKSNPVNVIVVQPNIDPYHEEFRLPAEIVLKRNIDLARPLVNDSTDFIISPESAIQEGMWEHLLTYSKSIAIIRRFIKPYKKLAYIIGASTWRKIGKNEKKTNAARKFRDQELYYYSYNTAFLIDNSGNIQLHHKSKLTPGVEKMPSWWFLKPLEKYAIDLGGTVGSLGWDDKPKVFRPAYNKIKVAPIICYESVYGEYVSQTVKDGAGLVFVITNDGWWGDTPGYRQHLLFSVLRAIETRRSVARSANTGVSAIIDQRGDILQKTNYWEPAALKATINANDELTFYTQYGDYIARVSAFVSSLLLLIAFTQGYLKKRKSPIA
jgi:apolipoprotein N-acyltransferase